MGKLNSQNHFQKVEKRIYALKFDVACLCCYAGSNALAPASKKVKHKIFTLIHITDVLVRTLRAAFFLEFNFYHSLCCVEKITFTDHFFSVRGWSEEENFSEVS